MVVFVARSARHPAPVIELALLRVRATRAANISVFVFSMGFFPLLLASVLFFTEVWHYSVVQAGVAIAPGPLMVAIFSWPAGAIAGRHGPRVVAIPGVLLFAVSCGWWAATAGASPDYLGEMLWPMVMVGIGVALTFPVLAGAAVADLPASRAATGSAIFNMARQIGGVAGVAVLIAILGSSTSMLDGLRSGWIFMAGAAVCSGAALLTLDGQPISSRSVTDSRIPDSTGRGPRDFVVESEPDR